MLLDDYAIKFHDGYQLEVSSLAKHDKQCFFDNALANDEVLQELIEDRLQELIDRELSLIEREEKYEKGLRPRQDVINGEIVWERGTV